MIFNLGFRITPSEKSDATKDEGRYIKEVLFHDEVCFAQPVEEYVLPQVGGL